MVFKSFHTQIVLRVLFLAATIATLVYLAMETTLYATSILVAFITAYQVWSLMNFVDRTNLSLSRFFDSIRYADFLQTNQTGKVSGSFEELTRAMDQVSDAFQSARAEKEENFRYLQTIIHHVGIGLLAYSDNGDVELMNPAARRLLQISQLRNLSNLEGVSESLRDTLAKIGPGEKALVKFSSGYETLQLSIHATKIRLGNRPLTLVSLQNIGSELAEQEMIAWQNLIRVLTHEIMNSMTPIASLAGSISGVVRSRLDPNGAGNKLNAGADQDIYDALGTIERRSQGLMHFVESYRDLTRIPIPDIRIVAVAELLSRVDRLMEKPLAEIGASRTTSTVPDSLTLACDPDLIEQVLINLYSNAVWALRGTEQPCLEVSARINREGRVVMEVKDNGPGILPAVIDKIFIPFFTTRKGGSGIGLAVSRQIMRLHNGNIAVTSTPGESTVFSLSF